MKKFLALCGLASVLALCASAATAGGIHWSVNVGLGAYYPPPTYYAPPYNNYSNYYAPPIVYGNSVPVYQAPPPVYYAPPPVVVYSYQDHAHHPHRHSYRRGHREYRDYRR